MTLPRQYTSTPASKQLTPAPRPLQSYHELEKEVTEKVSRARELLKETEERLSSGEMDLDDLAE